jgi:hypothetical protein
VMRSIEVVELHEAAEAAIERGPAGEVVPAEHHAPRLGENRLLQPLDEAVGPGVPRLDPRMANAQRPAGGLELGFELTAAIRINKSDLVAPTGFGRQTCSLLCPSKD